MGLPLQGTLRGGDAASSREVKDDSSCEFSSWIRIGELSELAYRLLLQTKEFSGFTLWIMVNGCKWIGSICCSHLQLSEFGSSRQKRSTGPVLFDLRPKTSKTNSDGSWLLIPRNIENTRGVPEMGVPLAIIHFTPFFTGIFHCKNHPFWGTPIFGNPHMSSYPVSLDPRCTPSASLPGPVVPNSPGRLGSRT